MEISNIIPFILLYAELHYRPKWLWSNYHINEPEILVDTPIRVEPGNDLPVMILIKDAHKYSITLNTITIKLNKKNQSIKNIEININKFINSRWWNKIIYINIDNMLGIVDIITEIKYSINGKVKNCVTHNFPGSSNHTLNSYLSPYKYPRDNNVQYGDLHYHTNLTEDMVEYGAPLKESLLISEAMGLDFYCCTDHSYDLDDKIGSWKETDPDLTKWYNSRKEIKELNDNVDLKSFIIPSEELSLHNSDGKNIHALILNNSTFLPGYGDGAENKFNFISIYDTTSIHDQLDSNSICIAAHPFKKIPILEQIFFKRGMWGNADIINERLIGMQILNGSIDKAYEDGLGQWIKLLLKGHKKYIYAGNDAHGNFNIYRQIKIPMLLLHEKKEQLFGKFRTGVFTKQKKCVDSVINGLKKGNSFITNGPYVNFQCINDNQMNLMGSQVICKNALFEFNVISSKEFGLIDKIIVYKGIIGNVAEEIIWELANIDSLTYNSNFKVHVNNNAYYRCKVLVKNIEEEIFAITNPIWLLLK